VLRTSAPLKGALGSTGNAAMEAILNWPTATLVIALSAFLLFRKEIGSLILRVQKISKSEATFADQATANQSRSQDFEAAEEVLKTLNGQILVEQEERIRADLNARGIEDPTQRERVLVRVLAVWQLVAAFEQVNARIFSSQISLLHAANDSPNGLTRTQVIPYLEYSLADETEKDDPERFDEYVGFLLRNRLIELNGENYKITPLGKELLVYQIHHGHPGPKLM
jgi:hypothetical protein